MQEKHSKGILFAFLFLSSFFLVYDVFKAENKPELTAFDSEFFRKLEPRLLSKGPIVASYNRINKEGMTAGQSIESINSMGKPSKKHFKGNKREKLRRITSHLDA